MTNLAREPYGFTARRCTNTQIGHYNHECGRTATWIGTTATGFQACFCAECKVDGDEARDITDWTPIAPK